MKYIFSIGLFLLLSLHFLGVGLSQTNQTEFKRLPSYSRLEIVPGKRGGDVNFALDDSPRSFFYYGGIDSNTGTVVSQVFDGLIEYNLATMQVEPALAKSWRVSSDGKVWDFRLRQGVRWHDGVELTADDVIFTYTQIVTNPQARGTDAAEFMFDGVPTIFEKIDRYNVRFTLNKPNGAFLQKLRKYIMPKHLLLKYSTEGGAAQADINQAWLTDVEPSSVVGTGPFMLRSYIPGQKVGLIRNPNYWKTDARGGALPYLDKINFLIINGTAAQAAQFFSGALDISTISGAQYPDFITRVAAGADFKVVRSTSFLGSVPNWSFNFDTANPELASVFSNLSFRKAMQLSLNRDRIIETVYNGQATLPGHGVSRNSIFYLNTTKYLGNFDLQTAGKQLDLLGLQDTNGDGIREFKSGKNLEFTLTFGSDSIVWSAISVILQNDLKKLGILVSLRGVPSSTLLTVARGRDWESIMLAIGNQPDPDLRKAIWQPGAALYYWHQSTQPTTPNAPPNSSKMQGWERQMYVVLEKASTETDVGQRRIHYGQWQVLMAKYLPVIMIAQSPSLAAVRGNIGNYIFTSGGLPTYNPLPLLFKR
jgi:peptide/nickel transport system substrate-binding protein